MNTRTKLLTAGVAVLALTGGMGATLASADTPSPAPTSGPSAATTPKATTPKAGKAGKQRPLQSRALHGEATVGGKKKQRVIDFQRGSVTAVSATSITVKSIDGFTATYTVTPQTKVRKAQDPASIGDVRTADRVRVVAVTTGSDLTARAIRDHGPKR